MSLKFEITVNWNDIGMRDNFFDAFTLFWTEIIKFQEADACQSIILCDMNWMHRMTINDENVMISITFYEIKKLAMDCGLLAYRRWEIPPNINPLPMEAKKLANYYAKLKEGIIKIGIAYSQHQIRIGEFLIDEYSRMPNPPKTADEIREDVKISEENIRTKYRIIAEQIR